MAYSDNFPQRPVFMADFANGGKIDPRASYTRSTTGTYFGTDKHLSSENLITQSNGDWYSPGTEYSKSTGQTGPDGSANATKFTEQAGGTKSYKAESNDFTPIANQEITYSVWLKQSSGSRDYQQIRVGNIGSGQAWATFNLTNGTVDQYGGALGVSASVTAGPTGWYQCIMRFTPTSTTALSFYLYAASASGGELPSVTGDTGNSYLLFGAQVSTTGETVVNATSGSIHRQYAPTLQTAAINAPRFEHSATDGQSMGILIEGAATNLSRYGSALASWANLASGARVESNVAIAPNGSLEADFFGSSVTTPAYRFVGDYSISITSGTTYTASVYLKASGHRYAQISGVSTGWATTDYVNYDLVAGTVSAGGSATGTLTNVGNGWFRATATMTANGSVTGSFLLGIINSMSDTRTPLFTANEYDGILTWGFQTEASSFASSLVDTGTSGSTATRASESLSMTDSSLFDTGSGAIICELGPVDGKVYPTAFALTDSSTQNIVRCQGNNGATQMSLVVNADNSGVATITQSFTSTGTKLGVSYDTNSFKFCTDGGTVGSDTAGQVPEGLNRLEIGGDTYSSSSLSGHVKRIALYGEALSDTNLQALTS